MSMTLAQYLSNSMVQDKSGFAVKNTILCLADASKIIALSLSKNGLPDYQMGIQIGDLNSDGDSQKLLDIIADKTIIKAQSLSSLISDVPLSTDLPSAFLCLFV